MHQINTVKSLPLSICVAPDRYYLWHTLILNRKPPVKDYLILVADKIAELQLEHCL